MTVDASLGPLLYVLIASDEERSFTVMVGLNVSYLASVLNLTMGTRRFTSQWGFLMMTYQL